MKVNFLAISFFILISISCVSATHIDIIYLNDNITTDIYYSTGNDINYIQNNTLNITEDITNVLIKNQYESIDIIATPEKVINYGVLIFWIILFVIMILFLITIGKRIIK